MEDSFSVRVSRVFGSLSSSPSSSKPLTSPSLWSLKDEEVEKKEWIRDKGSPDDADEDGASLPSDVDGFFANRKSVADEKRPSGFVLKELEDDLESLDDDEEKESGVAVQRRGSVESDEGAKDEDDVWEIRNSIGMDCTLDYEEEEDKYDKVAVGDEKRGDRIYMHEISDDGVHVSSFDEIPTSFREAGRDPRANHLAAMLRLKEDEDAAKNLPTLQISSEIEMSRQIVQASAVDERSRLNLGSDEMIMNVQSDQNQVSDSGKQVKSILKRKDDQTGSGPTKKVRFVAECKEDNMDSVATVSHPNRDASSSLQNDTAVPDYLRNPSKYTCYTFNDTDDMDEKSNQQGFMEFLSTLRKSKQTEPEEPPADLSQRVIFNPKRKPGDTSAESSESNSEKHTDSITTHDSTKKKPVAAIVAEEEADENGVCAMEEDSPQMEGNGNSSSRKRRSRQYRAKMSLEELDESGA